MKEDLELLSKINRIDSVILEMGRKYEGIPKRLEEIDEAIGEEEKRVELKKQRLRDLEKNWDQKQKFLDQSKKRVEELNDKLQNIRNEKEHAAVQKEIDAAGKINQSVKDEIDVIFDQMEQMGQEIKDMEAALEQLRESFADEKGRLQTMSGEARLEFESYEKERQALCEKLDPALLADYERIRDHRGVGVAYAANERCLACNISIPPQLYNQVLRGEGIRNCPMCGRILLPGALNVEKESAAGE